MHLRPKRFLGLMPAVLAVCLLGCHPDNRDVTVPYLNRDVSRGEVFEPLQTQPGAAPLVVGRNMPRRDFKQIPNAITDIDMLRYRGHVFTRDAMRNEMITSDMLAAAPGSRGGAKATPE